MTEKQELKVHVAMLGARLHYAVPFLLDQAGVLGTFYTDVYLGNKPRMRRLLELLPPGATLSSIKRLQGRSCAGLSASRVVSYDNIGLLSYWLHRRASSSNVSAIQARINKAFGDRVVGKGFEGGRAVYGFNGASLEIFQEAKRLGLICILEQTIAPYRILAKLLREEADLWPGWEPDLLLNFTDEILAEREEGEWPLADRIVCGSAFVEERLQSMGVSKQKCRIVPYGIDLSRFKCEPRDSERDVLNLLFVGEVSLRKGVPYLLEALRRLNSTKLQCRLVGHVSLDREKLADFGRWMEIVGPVPRSRMQEMYDWADVLVLPSICEGSALVTYEAMASGLPIITTTHAGAVARDGKEGFIVPIRDVGAIVERIDQLARSRELVREMSDNARRHMQDFTWEHYGERLMEVINEVMFSSQETENTLHRAVG